MMFVSKLKVAAASVVIGCGMISVSELCFGPGSRADGPQRVQVRTEENTGEPTPLAASMLPSAEEPGMLPQQPKPWETVVRMRILGERSVGIGSGTIIHSTPAESIVLTAALFHRPS